MTLGHGQEGLVVMTMISMGGPQGILRTTHDKRPSIGAIAKVLRDLLRSMGIALDDPQYATVHRAAQQLRGVTQADLARVVIAASAPRLLAALEGLVRGSDLGPEEAFRRLMASLGSVVPEAPQIDPYSLPASPPAGSKRTAGPSLEQLGLIPQPAG